MNKTSRNSQCTCGSGLKYKHCCLGNPAKNLRTEKTTIAAIGLAILSIVTAFSSSFYFHWETATLIAIIGMLLAAAVLIFTNPPKSTRDRSGSGNINFGK